MLPRFGLLSSEERRTAMPIDDTHLVELYKILHTRQVAPAATCEHCGTVLPVHSDAINMNFQVLVGVPGHAALMPFNCPIGEHWACSVACWRAVALKCIDNHIIPVIQAGLDRVGKGKPNP